MSHPPEPFEQAAAPGWNARQDTTVAPHTGVGEPTHPMLHALLDAVAGLVADIEGLVGESHGVYGLHLNGDLSPWPELLPGGRFERLTNLERVNHILASMASARDSEEADPLDRRIKEVKRYLHSLGFFCSTETARACVERACDIS